MLTTPLWPNWDIFEFRTFFIKAILQNNHKIIEIGTFLKNRDPPSVFKITKLKLGHFCFFTPPPYWDIVPNFLDFLFWCLPLDYIRLIGKLGIWSKKNLIKKIWSSFFSFKIFRSKKKFWLKKNIGHKNYESKNFQVKKILLQKIVSKNFGKNGVSNSWYIPDMDKCCQDKCCLDKCHHHVSWNLFKRVPGTYL